VIFDPHGVHLPGGAEGMRYTLEEISNVAPDALEPFAKAAQALGLDADSIASGHFNGTLFRLPLRDAAAGERSLLCHEALGEGAAGAHRARLLLKEFASQASDLIIFLQHVEAVGVFDLPYGEFILVGRLSFLWNNATKC